LIAASEAISSAAEPSLTPEALPAVTVPPSRTTGFSLARALQRRLARMLVAVDDRRAGLAGDLDRRDLAVEEAGLDGGGGALLAAQGEGVLVGAADAVVGGDVLGGLGHGVDAVGLLHRRIDEAPADGGVLDLGVAREKALSALPITNGARLMLSTPPAITRSAWSEAMARAA
jgi:hypothetical protein